MNDRIKKNIYIGIWIFVLILFQTSICHYWEIGGIYPNLMFVFAICLAVLERDFVYCLTVPIISAVLIDCMEGNIFFYNTLFFSVSALVCYAIGERFFKERIAFAVVIVFILTFISEFIYMFFAKNSFFDVDISGGMHNVILPLSVYNTAMTFVIYPLCRLTLYRKTMPKLIKKVKIRRKY